MCSINRCLIALLALLALANQAEAFLSRLIGGNKKKKKSSSNQAEKSKFNWREDCKPKSGKSREQHLKDLKPLDRIECLKLRYKEPLFLQSQAKKAAWLTGGRGAGTKDEDCYVMNLGKGKEKNSMWHYEWRFYGAKDRKLQESGGYSSGDCIKFGDLVYLHAYGGKGGKKGSQRYLTGGRGKGYEVRSNGLKENDDAWIWKIRPDIGKGKKSSHVPGNGECVMEDRSNHDDDGVRSVTKQESGDKEERLRWIIRREHGDGGLESAIACQPTQSRDKSKRPNSNWKYVNFSNGHQSFSFDVGTTNTRGKDVTKSWHWEVGVSATVEANGGVGSTSLEVNSNYGEESSETISESLDFSKSHSWSVDLSPGAVWQFETVVHTLCEQFSDNEREDAMNIHAKSYVITENKLKPPCCLPGLFKENDNPHGPCLDGTPCLCEDQDICFPPEAEPEPEPVESDSGDSGGSSSDGGSYTGGPYKGGPVESDSGDSGSSGSDGGSYRGGSSGGSYGGGSGYSGSSAGGCSDEEKFAILEGLIVDSLNGGGYRNLGEANDTRELGDVIVNVYNYDNGASGGPAGGGFGNGGRGGIGKGGRGGGYNPGSGGAGYVCEIEDELYDFVEATMLREANSYQF
ncbi:expressed unknown protein [Seminavis robusta]|uniref:Uncharacterized protein n=1 Tax=Seminavis robusta TaxID=568900 RepID=A0A9N8DA97_9STRA|nr:expressed unknown protein [Seminavis robusta]|eukprot:Sro10_g007860.1 n/a (629) ;mRNA; r:27583-29984